MLYKTTTSDFSAGPPSNPSTGDIWIASNVDANGRRWQFQYNAGSASTYKWEFIGGPPAYSSVDTPETTTTAWGSRADLATVGPSYTFVRAGDYFFIFSARCHNNTVNVGVVTSLSYGASFASFDPDTASFTSATANAEGMVTGQGVLTGQAAASACKLQYSTLSSGTGTWSQRKLFITPVRVS